MDPCLHDPNNHAPEVSPEDEWGDALALHPRESGATAILPPRRQIAAPKGRAAKAEPDPGLHIKPELSDPADSETERNVKSELEVTEISSDVLRLSPDTADTPEKVQAQVTFHERPARLDSRHAHDREWGESHKVALRWIAASIIGVGAIVVGALLALPQINKANAAKRNDGDTALEAFELMPQQSDQLLEKLILLQPEAEQAFRAYGTSVVVDDFLPFVRNREQIEPVIRSRHVPVGIPKSWLPPEDTLWEVSELNGLHFGVLSGDLPDYSEFRAYFVMSHEESLFIDWKATTGYGTATFSQLKQGAGDPAEIRAWLKPEAFYSLTYPESEYQCYKVTSPDQENYLWCYALLKSEVDESIRKLFRSGDILQPKNTTQRVTLRLESGKENSLPSQWQIAELLNEEWISPNRNDP